MTEKPDEHPHYPDLAAALEYRNWHWTVQGWVAQEVAGGATPAEVASTMRRYGAEHGGELESTLGAWADQVESTGTFS